MTDRTAYGGGIAAYVRSDFQCDRKKILEFKNIESICIEILVGNKKWLISGVYRPQTINEFFFHRVLEGVASDLRFCINLASFWTNM
jgi:hypothetical protein